MVTMTRRERRRYERGFANWISTFFGLYFWFQWDGVQTPEMQSRQRPPLPDWTDSGKGQSPPPHASQPLFRPDQIYESIYQQFFSPQITPSQPARPIDLVRSANSKGLIWSEVVGTNRLLYRKSFIRGSWLAIPPRAINERLLVSQAVSSFKPETPVAGYVR